MFSKRERALGCIVKNRGKATVTILMKLAYLTDLVSCKRTGKPIFDYDYKRYFYGPFDDKIYRDIEHLQSEKILNGDFDYTQEGNEYILYTFNPVKEKGFSFGLTDTEEKTIGEVLESVKGLGAKILTEIAYRTKPMKKLRATLGGKENLGKSLDLTLS